MASPPTDPPAEQGADALLSMPLSRYWQTLRPVAIAWALVGTFFLLYTLLTALLAPHPASPDTVGGLLYDGLWVAVALLLYRELPGLELLWTRHELARARERTLVYGIVGLVFGVVLGLLLLVSFLHLVLSRPIFSPEGGGSPPSPPA